MRQLKGILKWLAIGLSLGLVVSVFYICLVYFPQKLVRLVVYSRGQLDLLKWDDWSYIFETGDFSGWAFELENTIRVWSVLTLPVLMLAIAVVKRFSPQISLKTFATLAAVFSSLWPVLFSLSDPQLTLEYWSELKIIPLTPVIFLGYFTASLLPTYLGANGPGLWTLLIFLFLFLTDIFLIAGFGMDLNGEFRFVEICAYPFIAVMSVHALNRLMQRVGLEGFPR
jgi:hypothetical protein